MANPVLTLSTSSATYTEGEPATILDTMIMLSDGDDDLIEGVEIHIVGQPGDRGFEFLSATTLGGITQLYNDQTGSLTLTGNATVSTYMQVLNTVTYHHSGDSQTGDTRVISFTATDLNGDASAAQTLTLTLVGVNDAPETAGDHALTVALGQPVALTAADLSASDVDNLTSSLVFVVGTLPAHGALRLEGVALTSGDTFTMADIDSGLVTYLNDGVAGATADSFTVTAEDPDGAASPVATIAVTVQQPALLGLAATLAYTENDAATAIDPAATLADIDSTIDMIQISLVGSDFGAETLDFAPVGGVTGNYDAQTGVLTLSGPATTLEFEQALQSVTYVHAGDDPEASREITVLVTDADGLETERTLTVNITAVNDAPVLDTNAVIAVNEGDSTLLSSADLLYTDPDNTAAELTYTLDGLPAHGRLELGGAALALGDTFTQDDIDNGRLAYVHDGSETIADSFAFTVADPVDGILANQTATIEVTPVNDAPVLTAILSASVNRNGTLNLVSRYAASDADNDTLDVTLNATHGAITLGSTAGLTFTTGDGDADDTLVFSGLIADINAALGNLSFRPTANYSGSASIAVTLDDGDETASHTTAITVLLPGAPGGGDTIGGDVVTSAGTITMGPNAHNAILTGTADAAVYGNALGNDIQGNTGNNYLSGGAGDDLIRGAAGDDIVYGNEGEDVIYGNEGADILFGGQDADSVFGGKGDDAAYGNLANDVVYGNLGDDMLYGGQGDDVLYGGQGNDHLFGNKGDDILYAGEGDDTLTGGEGADSFMIQAGNHVTVTDFTAGEDVLSFLFDTAGAVFVDDGNGNALYDDGVTQVLLIGVDAATDGLIPMG